jgi:hypothetical protein
MLRHGAGGFITPPKEGVLRILIALESQSPSFGFELANIDFSSELANH